MEQTGVDRNWRNEISVQENGKTVHCGSAEVKRTSRLS